MSTETVPYDICPSCRRRWNDGSERWCVPCEIHRFQENFDKWTSGHSNVDALIRETQLNATGFHDYLEWIPYESLRDVEPLAAGGFAKVYSAIWVDCKRRWNYLSSQPKEIKVALKCPHNQEELGQLLSEISAYISCTKYSHSLPKVGHDGEIAANNYARGSNVLQCFGITYDSSRGYMMVSEYAPHGDLRQYLKEKKLPWCDKLLILRDIAKGLSVIHNTGLVHGDLHTGNVLQTRDSKVSILSNIGPWYRFISNNLYISPSASQNAPKICGVIPYMAPEVLRCKEYTKASDIYSLAMIMSEMASGEPPFAERCHNAHLILDICDGVRPIVSGPECFIELLERCWDADPTKRPNAEELRGIFERWARELLPYTGWSVKKADNEIARQFLDDETKIKTKSQAGEIHQGAVYKSRPLTEYITRAFECEIDFHKGNNEVDMV